jgi:hypothetical protein
MHFLIVESVFTRERRKFVYLKVCRDGNSWQILIIFDIVSFSLEDGKFWLAVVLSERIEFVFFLEIVNRGFLFIVFRHVSHHLHVLPLGANIREVCRLSIIN